MKTEFCPINHVLVRLASILLLEFPLPKFLASFQELDLLPERIAITIPYVFGQSRICSMFELPKLASARCKRVLHYFLPKYGQSFASQPLQIDQWQQEFLLVGGGKHVEPIHADHSELLELVCETNCTGS